MEQRLDDCAGLVNVDDEGPLIGSKVTEQYCDECGELVELEDDDSFTFYCDCGNEWDGEAHHNEDEE